MNPLDLLDFRRRAWRPGPLLPASDPRDAVLIFVIAALVFLACLTGIAALGANRAAHGWQAQLVGSASILVRPKPGETADGAAARATEAVAGVKGVVQAAMLDRAKAEALLRPWLGDEVLADLPIPRLVTVELDHKTPASAKALSDALAAAGVDASVDDHRLWMADIVRAGNMARWAALGVALLLAGVATAVIAFATRFGLSAYHEAVDLLHISGAEDGHIAGLFQLRFARLAAVAGAYGALAAIVLAAILRLAGGENGLTPVLPVAWGDLFAPLAAPFIAAAIGALAARAAALRLLGSLP